MKRFVRYLGLFIVFSITVTSCSSSQRGGADSDSANTETAPAVDPVDSIDSASSVATDSIDTNLNIREGSK